MRGDDLHRAVSDTVDKRIVFCYNRVRIIVLQGDTVEIRQPDKKKMIVSLAINLLLFLITTGVIVSYFFTDSEHVRVIIHSKDEVFWFFTTDSNILAAIAALVMAICEIRVLRGKADRLPKAAVILKFMGTACLMLTLLVCLLYLAPRFGFVFIFGDSFFHVHLSAPVMAFVSLCFFEKSERLSIPDAFLAFVPMAVYAAVYSIMVFAIGELNGGWRDLYHFTDSGSTLISVMLIIALDIVIILGQRAIYNRGIKK